MNDEDVEFDVFLVKGDFLGTCFRCGEPSTGSFDCDENENVRLKCVGCGFKQDFKIKREDNKQTVVCTFSG